MTAQRPALADVLARVTTCDDAAWWRDLVGRYGARIDAPVVLGVVRNGSAYDVGRLRHPTPADAVAALVEAELLPEHWADEGRAPRWWSEACRTCGGNGWIVTSTGDGSHGTLEQENCPDCEDGSGHAPAPPSHDALVAVASLGPDTLARAEAIVAETWPGARLVWRLMGAAEIREHHDEVHRNALPGSLRGERLIADAFVRAIESESCFYDSPRVRRAWPALRALAALGLHLVALDDARVVLAVEALA